MTEPVFAPTPYTGTDPIPAGAEWLYVRDVLFVLHGQYSHPENGNTELPPHRWVLARSPTAFVEGTTSVGGTSAILRPDTTGVDASATWSLMLVPVFDDGGDSSDYGLAGQVFLDVDKNRWVRSSEVEVGSDGLARIEPRRLLRIPLWTSKRMAASGGGFASVPPSAADFKATGTIKTSELAQFGTADAPWLVQIDQDWHRAFVQLRFYDFVAKKDRHLPQGIFLVMEKPDALLGIAQPYGASSVLTKDGAIYVLGAGALAKLDGLHYAFGTPATTELDVAKDTYSTVAEGPALERVGTHYWPPVRWVSDMTQPWEGPSDPTDSTRDFFGTQRGKGTDASKPLCFHLDDLVFSDTSGAVSERRNDRIAVYDSLLLLRDQAKSGAGKPVPWTDFKPKDKSSPLPAEKVVFVRGEDANKLTRAVAHNAKLYILGPTRIDDGIYAGTLCAREMVGLGPDTTDMWSTKAHVMALPTPWATYTYRAKKTHPTHIVMFLPLFADVSNLTAAVAAQQADAKDAVEEGIYRAMGRWDQQHPGNVDADSKDGKNYTIVPKGGATDGGIVAKVRHIFTSELDKTGSPGVIEVWPKGRANAPDVLKIFLLWGDDSDPLGAKNALTPADMAKLKRPFEFEPKASVTALDPFDKLSAQWATFAHELGHWSGLPDEYTDMIDTSFLVGNTDRFPAFSGGPKPFLHDSTAMMHDNEHPRLRYLHRPVCNLRDTVLDPDKDPPPDIIEYEHGGTTLSYPVWTTEAPKSPWQPLPASPDSLGACRLSLFRVGEDEATKTGSFLPVPAGTTVTGGWDGILVVACSFWFDVTRVNKSVGEQWGILSKFASLFYDVAKAPHFAIDTPGAKHFKRVAVLFQPRFEFSPNASTGATSAGATLIVSVRQAAGAPTLTAGSPPTVDVARDDVGLWIMRYALQADPTTLPPVANGPLTAADLATVVAHLQTIAETSNLDPPGRGPGTPSAYA